MPESRPAVFEVDEDLLEAEHVAVEGAACVEVGVVFELHGEIRLVDVFDPDGNRVQLAQSLN